MKQEDVFLMRRWRNHEGDDWRFSLKDVHSGEIRFFSSDKALSAYLSQANSSSPAKSSNEKTAYED
jgi:hypothetical protein